MYKILKNFIHHFPFQQANLHKFLKVQTNLLVFEKKANQLFLLFL